MPSFHYVYILVSETNPDRHYTGSTEDLDDRLRTQCRPGTAHFQVPTMADRDCDRLSLPHQSS